MFALTRFTPNWTPISSRLWHCVVIILIGFVIPLSAQQLPTGFSNTQVQDGYDIAVGSAFSADGKQLFVWEKAGRIFVSNWNGTTYVRQNTPVLDISDEVGNWRDFGLLSVCLDPNFSTNGLLYLYYVVDRHHLRFYGTSQYSRTADEYYNATITRVTRYRVAGTAGTLATDQSSRQVLIGETKTTGIPLTYESHAGGTLAFGRDGTLLISTGDNAGYDGVDEGSNQRTYYQTALNDGIMRPAENVGALRAQMIGSLCGKVLRIDPTTGNGLGSNPFYDPANPRAAQSRVWTMGLRNPFRMCVQPNTGSTNPADGSPGTLMIGDVGWFTAEDFNLVDQAGLNCGWPLYEGMDKSSDYYGHGIRNQDEPGQPAFESLCVDPTSPTPNATPNRRRFTHTRPALDWLHASPVARVPAFEGNTPITKLVGSAGAPAGVPFSGNASIGGVCYTGSQFPTTYQNSYFFADFGQNWIRNLVMHDDGDHQIHEVREFAPANTGQGIVDLKVNPLDGSLFYVNVSGQIMRISYGGNQPPVAQPTATITSGSSPLSVQFSGTNSTDPEGKPLHFHWDFGDGTSSDDANPNHVFSSTNERSFTVTLTVTDDGQQSHSSPLTISLNGTAPTARITSPADGSLYPMDRSSTYTLMADVTGDNLTYEWQVALHHNEHEHPEPVQTEVSPQIRISPVGCSATDSYSYRISLKVTNRSGQSTTTSVRIYPDCPPASATGFAIAGVTTVRCETVTAGGRQLTFTPQYTGLNGQPVSFSVVSEMMPTTNPGPYSLRVYTDNPIIHLQAQQSGTAAGASFAYNWLNACNNGSTQPPSSTNQPPSTASSNTTPPSTPPSTLPVTTGFNLAGVTMVRCETISTGLRQLTFTPQYTGLNGQPITFSVIGEMNPTTDAGPYTLRIYTDNPALRLQAQQNGTPGTASFSYSWLSACAGGTTPAPPTQNPVTTSPPPSQTPPSASPPATTFGITGVTTVRCETLSGSQRQLTFTPQYAGLNGQPVSFSVANEMLPTTSPGPYSLQVYTDNPVVTLKATQTDSPGEASFAYHWLTACTNTGGSGRLGAVSPSADPAELAKPLLVQVFGNPVLTDVADVEIRGGANQWLRVTILDGRGYPVSETIIPQAMSVERCLMKLNGPAGLYVLCATTSTQYKVVKLLKQ